MNVIFFLIFPEELLKHSNSKLTNTLGPINYKQLENPGSESEQLGSESSTDMLKLDIEKRMSVNKRKRKKRKQEVKTNSIVNEALSFVGKNCNVMWNMRNS